MLPKQRQLIGQQENPVLSVTLQGCKTMTPPNIESSKKEHICYLLSDNKICACTALAVFLRKPRQIRVSAQPRREVAVFLWSARLPRRAVEDLNEDIYYSRDTED